MWLLKFHVSVSILCILATHGIRIVFKERLSRYKRRKTERKKFSFIKMHFILFCPLLNVMLPVIMLHMAFLSDEDAETLITKLEADEGER